jgi:hypothetical protein
MKLVQCFENKAHKNVLYKNKDFSNSLTEPRNIQEIEIFHDNFGKRIEQKYQKKIDEAFKSALYQLTNIVKIPAKIIANATIYGYGIYESIKNKEKQITLKEHRQLKDGDCIRHEIDSLGIVRSVIKNDRYDPFTGIYHRGESVYTVEYKQGKKFNPHFKIGTPEAKYELEYVKFIQGIKNDLPITTQINLMSATLHGYQIKLNDQQFKKSVDIISGFKDKKFDYGDIIDYTTCRFESA